MNKEEQNFKMSNNKHFCLNMNHKDNHTGAFSSETVGGAVC